MVNNRKEQGQKGLSFKNRKGKEYIFYNEGKYKMAMDASTPAPFPDIAVEVPGILTKQEEMMGVDEVIQSKP
jgi:hypothetical protein